MSGPYRPEYRSLPYKQNILVHLRVAASTIVAVDFGSGSLGRPHATSKMQKGQHGRTFVMDTQVPIIPVFEYAEYLLYDYFKRHF